jgi:hypothetical protein
VPAGAETAEIERLDWTKGNLAGKFIEVTAAKAKTASRRRSVRRGYLLSWGAGDDAFQFE